MTTHRISITILAAAVASSSFAVSLGSNSAYYTGSYGIENVKYSHNYAGGGTRNDPTVRFNGDRNDLPAGPGVNTVISDLFNAYCVEVGETISLNSVTAHTEVFNLLGATTQAGGFTGPRTFTPARTLALEKLWGSYFGSVNSNTTSAAFQLAQWEITFDDDLTLAYSPTAMMWVNAGDASAASAQAQTWLDAIRNGSATTRQGLLLLRREGKQDLVTPVPEPASMAALGLGAIALIRRRKRA